MSRIRVLQGLPIVVSLPYDRLKNFLEIMWRDYVLNVQRSCAKCLRLRRENRE